MSRKWERMVRKNTKVINKHREKFGRKPISNISSDGSVTFKGRNWFLPIILVAIGVICLIVFRDKAQEDSLYWITGISYFLLAVLTYYTRRPFLKLGKDFITTRRFGGDRTMDASQISDITINKNAIIVTLKPKGNKWFFTRAYHQFQIESMREMVQKFAEKHGIALNMES